MDSTIDDEASPADRIQAPAQPTDPFGVYIHVPFCMHICPYCDFNTYAGQSALIPRYVEAMCAEIARWAPSFVGRTGASLFLGGGTPSLLNPDQICTIVDAARNAFNMAPDAEITMEANPDNISQQYCDGILHAGINRISLGAQTLDRRGLRVLGRLHEASRIGAAMLDARSAGFSNVSLDFIYGWPGQTIEQWSQDLEQILSGDIGGSIPDHLSLYGLIIEPGTPMADAVTRGILTAIDDDTSADFLELAIASLARAGWTHYEIANWSASPATFSRHNAIYWRNGDYAGIGAGAHGHIGNQRTINHPSPGKYVEILEAGGNPTTNRETISERTAMGETIMLGLRLLRSGVSIDAFARRHGVSLLDQFGTEITRLVDIGVLEVTGERATLTHRGMLLTNSVVGEFIES